MKNLQLFIINYQLFIKFPIEEQNQIVNIIILNVFKQKTLFHVVKS